MGAELSTEAPAQAPPADLEAGVLSGPSPTVSVSEQGSNDQPPMANSHHGSVDSSDLLAAVQHMPRGARTTSNLRRRSMLNAGLPDELTTSKTSLLELFDTKEKEKPIRGKVGGKVSEDRFKETQRIAGTRYKFEINVDYKLLKSLMVHKGYPEPPTAEEHAMAYSELLADVTNIRPGSLATAHKKKVSVVHCILPYSFPVFCDENLQPVVVGAQYGKGRVMAFGHHDFLIDADAYDINSEHQRFMSNAVGWMTRGNPKPNVLCHMPGTRAIFERFLNIEGSPITQIRPDIFEFDLVVIRAADVLDAQVDLLMEYIERGGSVIIAGAGHEFSGEGYTALSESCTNLFCSTFGIIFTSTIAVLNNSGQLIARSLKARDVDGGLIFSRLAEYASGISKDSSEIFRHCMDIAINMRGAMPVQAACRPPLPAINELAIVQPSAEVPVQRDEVQARACSLFIQLWRDRLLNSRTLIPAASDARFFPGLPTSTTPQSPITMAFDTSIPGWHSTGLYAAPGEHVTITIKSHYECTCMYVRIGCHTDEFWNLDPWSAGDMSWRKHYGSEHKDADAWLRWPTLSTCHIFVDEGVGIDPVCHATNPHGGLIYICMDTLVQHVEHSRIVDIEISNAITAPTYVLGVTTPEQWATQRKTAPAPWGELVGKNIILTLPTATLRDMESPDAVLEFWDKNVDVFEDLSSRSTGKVFQAIRVVADIQLSHGFMHSGYPVMIHLESIEEILNLEKLQRRSYWPLLHEIGHNFQDRAWTISGYEEVTCNLFALYAMELTVKREPQRAHPALRYYREEAFEYLMSETSGNFTTVPPKFQALSMYIMLYRAFGWEAFRKVFYQFTRMHPLDAPKSDQHRKDEWVVRFSRVVNYNLESFFAMWGIAVSQDARERIMRLPRWVPTKHSSKAFHKRIDLTSGDDTRVTGFQYRQMNKPQTTKRPIDQYLTNASLRQPSQRPLEFSADKTQSTKDDNSSSKPPPVMRRGSSFAMDLNKLEKNASKTSLRNCKNVARTGSISHMLRVHMAEPRLSENMQEESDVESEFGSSASMPSLPNQILEDGAELVTPEEVPEQTVNEEAAAVEASRQAAAKTAKAPQKAVATHEGPVAADVAAEVQAGEEQAEKSEMPAQVPEPLPAEKEESVTEQESVVEHESVAEDADEREDETEVATPVTESQEEKADEAVAAELAAASVPPPKRVVEISDVSDDETEGEDKDKTPLRPRTPAEEGFKPLPSPQLARAAGQRKPRASPVFPAIPTELPRLADQASSIPHFPTSRSSNTRPASNIRKLSNPMQPPSTLPLHTTRQVDLAKSENRSRTTQEGPGSNATV